MNHFVNKQIYNLYDDNVEGVSESVSLKNCSRFQRSSLINHLWRFHKILQFLWLYTWRQWILEYRTERYQISTTPRRGSLGHCWEFRHVFQSQRRAKFEVINKLCTHLMANATLLTKTNKLMSRPAFSCKTSKVKVSGSHIYIS